MGEASFFLVVCEDGTRNTGLKLEHRKLSTNMWKKFLWFPREVMESPSVVIFKAHLDAYLEELL